MEVYPFIIHIPEPTLVDLKNRRSPHLCQFPRDFRNQCAHLDPPFARPNTFHPSRPRAMELEVTCSIPFSALDGSCLHFSHPDFSSRQLE